MATDKRVTKAAESGATPPALTDAQLSDLIAKALQGDKKAWAAVKAGLDKVPAWETRYEPPTVFARRALLQAVARDNPVVQEAWQRRTETLTKELIEAGDATSPLERILCERVATCWLEMAVTDMIYASRTQESISLDAGDYYQRMKDRAHKRYLSACTSLAKVRRLLAPVAQQVNIAQPGASQLNITHSAQSAAAAAAAALPDAPATVGADGPAERY